MKPNLLIGISAKLWQINKQKLKLDLVPVIYLGYQNVPRKISNSFRFVF